MKTEITITTLGQLRIEQNGQIVGDFISTKATLLFVYLAMHPGEHSRKKLAAMFWSETHDQQALKNLRTVLSSIRQNLPDALMVSRDGLAIHPDAIIQVDASIFEQEVTSALASPNILPLVRRMQELAELYRGSFLADIAFREAAALEDWITEKQRHLHELYTRLLYEIVELAHKQGEYDTGIQYARRLVSLDPYWDTVRRQLMRLLAYTNRANEALLQYEEFTRLLANELGAEPEEETRSLYEQIRSRRLRPPQQRTKRSSIVLPDMPFVEAVEDITLAQRMLNTPQCHLLTIYGISGIGKTSLATQIAFQRQHLYEHGAHLVSLKGSHSTRDLPYLIAGMLDLDIPGQIDHYALEEFVLEYLRDRHLLLLLDNYDHLLPDTDFIHRILEQATRAQLVITSQAPLNLFREWLLPLTGLRVPSLEDEDLANNESVRLFDLTVQRINPRFNLQDNLEAVVRICQLVDGLPLALIIAAGWTQIAPINKIAEYITEGQEFSLPLHQELAPHHQSLEMMLEYTWNTLGPPEQFALMSMSIFNTAFDIDEVQQICGIDFGVLTTMIQKSLIQKYDEKYRMHQLIWRYARKKLLFNDQREELGRRYLDYAVQTLRNLQEEKLPLHEYLLEIEMQYARLWNFDWMLKSFQPIYILALSRFLIAYWEISRDDELPAIYRLFESINPHELTPEDRMLLNLQRARFFIRSERKEPALELLAQNLAENAVNTLWADWAAVFNLCMPLSQLMLSGAPSVQVDEDVAILGDAYLKLLSLYLDMHDHEAADGILQYLLESEQESIHPALILATQGTIAAEYEQYPAALMAFSEALNLSQGVDYPLLRLGLHTLAMRAANSANDNTAGCQHLASGLAISLEYDLPEATLQLLSYCRQMSQITRHESLNRTLAEHLEHTQAAPGAHRQASRELAQAVMASAATC